MKHRTWAKDIWYGIVGFALIYVCTLPFFIAILPERAKISKDSLIANLAENEYPPHIIIIAVFFMAFATIVCAFWEEIYWRGYMQNGLSRKLAPAAGFLASMIFFTLSHYITRPYSITITILVLVSGTIFGLIFYATGSLWIALIIHSLGNLCGDYPAYLYIKGSVTGSYVFAGSLGVFSLIICILGRNELKHLFKKTLELFKLSGWKMSFLGIILGCIALFYVWLQDLLKKNVSKEWMLGILVAFSIVAIGISFLEKNKKTSKV